MKRKSRQHAPGQVLDRGTAERAAKGDLVEAQIFNTAGMQVGRGRRSVLPIERLAGSLEPHMLLAALRLRRDHELGVLRVVDRDRLEQVRVDGGFRSFEPSQVALDAGRRVMVVRDAMGDYVASVVLPAVCEDMPLPMIATARGQNRQELVGILKAGLSIAARLYRIPAEAAA